MAISWSLGSCKIPGFCHFKVCSICFGPRTELHFIFSTPLLFVLTLLHRESFQLYARVQLCDQHSGNVIIRSMILGTLLFSKHTKKYFTTMALQNWLSASSKVYLVGDNGCKGVQISFWVTPSGEIFFSFINFEEEEGWTLNNSSKGAI